MKHLAAAVAFAAFAGTAQAGSMADPVVETPIEVVVADAVASSGPSAGVVLGLMTVLIFGTALAGN